MKRIFYFVIILFALWQQTAIAVVPVTLSGPVPVIDSSYIAGNIIPNVYTVTNNVPHKSFPIVVSGIMSPVHRIVVSNDCNDTIPAGPSTCQIGILISPTNIDAGQTFNQTLAIDYQGRMPLTAPISFSVPSFIFPAQIAIAVGNYNSSPQYPFLAQIMNGPASWRYGVDSTLLPTNFKDYGTFLGANCNGVLCAAGGSYMGNDGNVYPLIAQTTNNGWTWSYKIDSSSIPSDFQTRGGFNATTCSTTQCIAGGQYRTSIRQYPLLAESSTNGSNWSYMLDSATVPSLYNNYGQFQTVSCSKNVCIAAGAYFTTNLKINALLAKSSNGGAWSYVIDAANQPSDLTDRGDFFSSCCNENLCIAGGTYRAGTTIYPMLAQSTDSGGTWSYVISSLNLPSDYSNNGRLSGAHCTSQFCIAAGSYQSTDSKSYPMIARSQQGPWTYVLNSSQPPPNYDSLGNAKGLSCSDDICVVVGTYSTDSGLHTYPFVAQSTDGGLTWTYPVSNTSPALPPDYGFRGTLNAASCLGIVCIASGSYQTGTSASPGIEYPLLVLTIDKGNTWFYKIDSATLPHDYQNLGYFRASGLS